MTIRLYKKSDKEKLVELFKLNTPDYFAPHEQSDFERYLETHSTTYYVVEQGRKIVGCGGYHVTEVNSVGRISWNLVHPDYKRKGMGKQLVNYCIEKLRNEKAVRMIVVWTSQLAYIFYGKFGFRIRDIQRNYWGKGLHLFMMEFPVR